MHCPQAVVFCALQTRQTWELQGEVHTPLLTVYPGMQERQLVVVASQLVQKGSWQE